MTNAALKTETVEVPIQASIHEIEPAWQTRLGTVWLCRTRHRLDSVLAPGYFDAALSHGFRVNDRIELVCLATEPATHATLAIDAIRYAEPGEARCITRVLQIHAPERKMK